MGISEKYIHKVVESNEALDQARLQAFELSKTAKNLAEELNSIQQALKELDLVKSGDGLLDSFILGEELCDEISEQVNLVLEQDENAGLKQNKDILRSAKNNLRDLQRVRNDLVKIIEEAGFELNESSEVSLDDGVNDANILDMSTEKIMPDASGPGEAGPVSGVEKLETDEGHKIALIQEAKAIHAEMVDLCNVATPEEMLGANNAMERAETIFQQVLKLEQDKNGDIGQLEELVLELNDYKEQLTGHLASEADVVGDDGEILDSVSVEEVLPDSEQGALEGDLELAASYRIGREFKDEEGKNIPLREIIEKARLDLMQTARVNSLPKKIETILQRISKSIGSLNRERNINRDNRAESYNIGKKIREAYDELGNGVAEYLEHPDRLVALMEVAEANDAPKDLEALEQKATFLKGEFLNLKEQMLALGIPDQGIFDLVTENFTKLDSCHDDDKNRVFIDKSNYLKTLEGNIGAMREAVRVAGEATSEEAPVSAPEVAPVSTETSGEEKVNETKESAGLSYQEKRETWRKSNEAFKTAEREYNQSLKDYYENRGVLSKGWAGARSLFGMSPKFPREVAVLQAKYQTARNFYAREFNELLALRTKFNESNADRSLKTDKYKAQFARKFILKPTEKLLELQEKTAMSEAESSKMRKVMKIMSKNKWGIRVGTVVLAGTIGALSGGASLAVVAAGSRAARIGAGMLGGTIAGAGINRAMKGYVDEAGNLLVSAKESVSANFTLDNLDQLESEMLSAKAEENSRKSQRMAATILASGVAGFGAGYGTGALASEVVPPGGGNGVGGERGLNPSNPGASGTPEAPASAASAAEKVASATEASEGVPIFQIGKVSVPAYNPDGTLASEQVISGFELKSSNVNFTGSGLSDVEGAKVTSSMKLAAQDVLAERPHISQGELEKIVFEKLKSEYGNTGWWQEAKISSVSIADMDFVDTVESGDNLSTILHKQLIAEYKAGNLNLPKGMSESQLADYMYKKFPELVNQATDKPGLSMEEWQKLGLRSEDLNKISVGQKINLGDVIDVINDKPKLATTGIDTGLTAEDLPARPKTGALPIKDSDGFEKLIKIKSDLPWKDISPQELEEARIQGILDGTIDTPPPKGLHYPSIEPGPGDNSIYTVPKSSLGENVPTRGAYELPQMPKLMHPVAGQYFTSPEFINYLKANGLSMEVMEKVIEKTADDFEAQTYTRGEIFYNTYDSPYDHLSGLTMAKVIEIQAQAGGSEKVLIQLLREQAPDANFKAETLRAWSQWVGATIETNKVPFGENTTLADVFSRSVSQNIVEHTYKNNLSGVVQQSSGGNSYFDIVKRRLAEGVDRGPLEKRTDSYSFRKR